jgi:uncharacterized membrane protein
MANHVSDTTAERHPDMDYAQHEATYRGFMFMVKWGIISMAFVVVALYAFIELHNAWLGVLLLLAMCVVLGVRVAMGGRRR